VKQIHVGLLEDYQTLALSVDLRDTGNMKNKVITTKPLLVDYGSAWDNKQAHILKGTIFTVEDEYELDDRIIVHNDDYRIALYSGQYRHI